MWRGRICLCAEIEGQLDTEVAEVNDVHLHLKLRKDELITPYDAQAKAAAEVARLSTKNARKVSKLVGLESGAKESERSDKRTKAVCVAECSLGVSLVLKFAAQLADRDKLKSRCDVLVLKTQSIPGFLEDAKQWLAKVANIEKKVLRQRSILQTKAGRSGSL